MNAHYNFAEIYVSKDHQVGLRAPSVFSCVIFRVLEIDKKKEKRESNTKIITEKG